MSDVNILVHEGTDLFTLDVQGFAHGCNTKGLMGKGVAKEFRKRFPRMYFAYQVLCSESDDLCGSCMTFYENGKVIFNLFTQDEPGHYSRSTSGETVEDRLTWIYTSLQEMFSYAATNNMQSIGMPAIGAGISGLNWGDVYNLLCKAFQESGWTGTVHIALL